MFFLLHYVIKIFTSPDPCRIQSHVCAISWIQPNFGLVVLNVDDNVFFESNLMVLVVLFVIIHGLFYMDFSITLVDPAFCMLKALCLSNFSVAVDLVRKGLFFVFFRLSTSFDPLSMSKILG